MRFLVTVVALLALVACGADEPDEPQPAPPSGAEQKTCALVRAGIDAFNEQDYDATVEHFVKVEVFAKVYSKEARSAKATALLQAVDYYAHLPASKYPEAARSSPDFAKYKAITLGQCVEEAEDDGVDA